MNYFKDCRTLDDAKKTFRRLSMELHPDKGGTNADFIELRKQFKAFRPSETKDTDKDFNFDRFENLVYKFNNLDNIIVDFVGTWIYLRGDTYNNKEAIKSLNLDGYKNARFSKSKRCWYFMPEGVKLRKVRGQKLSKIKAKYGCQSYTSKGQLKLN